MSVHDVSSSAVVVAVDVGKNTVALSVTRSGLAVTLARISAVVPATAVVTVGIEAAGHYHQPLMARSSWPVGWELRELNPAHVTEQRRVQGRRRVKTDAIDLEAITELVLAGQGPRSPTVRGRSASWPHGSPTGPGGSTSAAG